MKKISIILALFLCIFCTYSCTNGSLPVDTALPIEVSQLKEVGKYDTLLTIMTNNKIYVFDQKDHKYSYTIDRHPDDAFRSVWLGFLIGLMVIILLLILSMKDY